MGMTGYGAQQALKAIFSLPTGPDAVTCRAILSTASGEGKTLDGMLASNEVVAYQDIESLALTDPILDTDGFIYTETVDDITFDVVVSEITATHVCIYPGSGTGDMLWSAPLTNNVAVSGPTLNIYTGESNSDIVKRDPDTFDPIWIYSSISEPNAVAVDASGNVYVAAQNFQKINSSGSLVWESTVGGQPPEVNDIEVDAGGYVYDVDQAGDVRKSNGNDGSEVWSFSMEAFDPSEVGIAITVDSGGNVYGASSKGLYKVDSTGTVVWSIAVSAGQNTAIIDVAVNPDDGSVYYIFDGNVYKVDSSGTAVWDVPAGGLPRSLVIDSDGFTYVALSAGLDNYVRKFNPNDGSLVWEAYIGSNPSDLALGSDGFLYVTLGSYGQLNKIDSSGSNVGSINGSMTTVAADPGIYSAFPTEWGSVEFIFPKANGFKIAFKVDGHVAPI